MSKFLPQMFQIWHYGRLHILDQRSLSKYLVICTYSGGFRGEALGAQGTPSKSFRLRFRSCILCVFLREQLLIFKLRRQLLIDKQLSKIAEKN